MVSVLLVYYYAVHSLSGGREKDLKWKDNELDTFPLLSSSKNVLV